MNMKDQKIIEYGVEQPDESYDEQKNAEFEDFFKTLGTSFRLKVFKKNGINPKSFCGTIDDFDATTDDIYEIIKTQFGPGKFYIQGEANGRYVKGAAIQVVIENTMQQTALPTANPELELLKKQIEDLKTIIANKNQNEDSELKIIEKMRMYKELFGGGEQKQANPADFFKEMRSAYKEGFETGKIYTNPVEEKETDSTMQLIQSVLPMLMGGLMNKQHVQQMPAPVMQNPVQNIQPVMTEPKKTEEPKKINEEDEAVRIAYLSLFGKLKKIAVLPDGSEEKEAKINLIIDEIFEYFPEMIDNFDKVEDINTAIELLTSNFPIKLNDSEKKLIVRIYNEIGKQLKEDK